MIEKNAHRVGRLIRYATQDKFFEGLVVILALFSFVLGLLFLFTNRTLDNSKAFDIAFDWIAPPFWAGGLIVGSILLAVMAIPHRTRQDAMWPGFLLGGIYSLLGLAFIRGSFVGGIPSGIVIYLFAAFICMWVVAGCAFYEREEPHATPQNAMAYHS